MKAKIEWLSEEEGGRNNPPPGPRYITVARFEAEKDKYPNEAWSLVLEFASNNNSQQIIADVNFLVQDAPAHLLSRGSLFELYEGRVLVGRGRIL